LMVRSRQSSLDSARDSARLTGMLKQMGNKPWVRELSDPTSPEHDWYQLFAGGLVPEEFPLSHARYISGGDQFILADQPRWTW